MRKIVSILLATAMLPVFGADSPGARPAPFSILPPTFDLALPGFSEKDRWRPTGRLQPGVGVIRLIPPTCYYIRQLNKNLKKPSDKPVFLPVANEEMTSANSGDSNCLTDSIVRGAVVP